MKRCSQKRVDTPELQELLARVRKLIFEKGARVGGAQIKRILEALSVLPVQVSSYVHLALDSVAYCVLERIFYTTLTLWLQPLCHVPD